MDTRWAETASVANEEFFTLQMAQLQSKLGVSDFECTIIRSFFLKSPRTLKETARELAVSVAEITRRLSDSSNLRQSGCIIVDEDRLGLGKGFRNFLNGLAQEPVLSEYLIPLDASKEDVLPWRWHGKKTLRHRFVIEKIAAKEGGSLNILLYGVPGTGKEAFARTLAYEFNLSSYRIVSEKGVKTLCRLMRTITTSAVWVTDVPVSELGEDCLKMFDYSICFDPLSEAERFDAWTRLVGKMRLGKFFPDSRLKMFASRYLTGVDQIARVLWTVRDSRKKADDPAELAEKLLKRHCELMDLPLPDESLKPSEDYSLDGLNVKNGGCVTLDELLEIVRDFREGLQQEGGRRGNLAILLYGVSGGGKSELARWLAQELDARLLLKSGGQLLDQYVGGSEKLIARAFRQAESENAILLMDECDSLLGRRTAESKSWEVSQVNEMLVQMDRFKGVVIMTTNLVESLDPASLRRFTFRFAFDYLTADGLETFWKKIFGSELSESESARLKTMKNLAPGDFAAVKKEFAFFKNVTNDRRLSALEDRSASKSAL